MACTGEVTRLKEKLAKKELLLAAYEASELAFAENVEIKQYRFNSGMATQMVMRQDPDKIAARIYQLEREIESIRAELCGFGIVYQNLRRLN